MCLFDANLYIKIKTKTDQLLANVKDQLFILCGQASLVTVRVLCFFGRTKGH